ncbi:DUF4328 domain-containing protein [Nocardia brasiliensis]|uniref:DUF4328 domain-containing protein n=1 Tax=Nocardia brasiliensis TaxID=37326 RepID=UPI002456AF3E|nr:DUF4328 domain-containing protein [Nocardia brasiliensis]
MPHAVGERHYRPLETLGAVAIVALIANMFVRAVFWVANLRNYMLLDDYASGAVGQSELLRRSEELDVWFALSLPVAALTTVFTLSAVIAWLWRARTNAEFGCAARHRLARGWVVGGWFVPIVSLWFPPVLVDDVVRASDPGTAPHASRLTANATTPLVVLWWLALLGGQIMLGVTTIYRLLTTLSLDPVPAAVAMAFEAISLLLFAVAAAGLVAVITRVGRWQAERHRAAASATTAPTPRPETPPSAATVMPHSSAPPSAPAVTNASTATSGTHESLAPVSDAAVVRPRGRESGVPVPGGWESGGRVPGVPVPGGRESGASISGSLRPEAFRGTAGSASAGRSRRRVAVLAGAVLGVVALAVAGAAFVVRQGDSAAVTLAADVEMLRTIDPCTLLDQEALDLIGPGPAPEPGQWGECVRPEHRTAKYDTDSPLVWVRAGWTYFDAPSRPVGETSFGLTMSEPDRGAGCVRQVATTDGNGIEIEVGVLPNGRDCDIATELVPRVLARLAAGVSQVRSVPGSLIGVDPCKLVDRAVIRDAVGVERNRSMESGVHVCRHSGNQTSLQVTLGRGMRQDHPLIAKDLIPFEIGGRPAFEVRAGESVGWPTSDTSLPQQFECEVRYVHAPVKGSDNVEIVAIQVGEDRSRGVDHATACARAKSALAALLPELPTP